MIQKEKRILRVKQVQTFQYDTLSKETGQHTELWIGGVRIEDVRKFQPKPNNGWNSKRFLRKVKQTIEKFRLKQRGQNC